MSFPLTSANLMREIVPVSTLSAPKQATQAAFFSAEAMIAAKAVGNDISSLTEAGWFALRDKVTETVEAIGFAQLEESALSGLESLLGEMRSSIAELEGLDANTTEYDAQQAVVAQKEIEISQYIGGNIGAISKLTYIGLPSNDGFVQGKTVIDYMDILQLSTESGQQLGELGVLEVEMADVMNSYHDAATCPVCMAKNAQQNNLASPDTLNEHAAPTSPTSVTQGVTYGTGAATGTNYVDALTGSSKWDLSSSNSVSYSYYDGGVASPDYDPAAYDSGTNPLPYDEGATSIVGKAAQLDVAFEALGAASALEFDRVVESSTQVGEIRVAYTNSMPNTSFGGGAAAFAYMPSTSTLGGDIWFGDATSIPDNGDFAQGTYGFYTALHELGHAVGLSHPFLEGGTTPSSPTGVTLASQYDNVRHTMMSYNQNKMFDRNAVVGDINMNQDGSYTYSYVNANPTTPMLYDVAALESFYGVSTTTNLGNTNYTFTDGEVMLRSIVDSGGVDTIDGSAQTRGSIIDLNAGKFSSIGLATVDQAADAAAQKALTAYENLNGGPTQSSASLLASYKTNFLSALNSLDVAGNTIYQTAGNDAVYLGQDNVSIAFSSVIENAKGGAGNDKLTGNSADNALAGGAGNDTLEGGGGNRYGSICRLVRRLHHHTQPRRHGYGYRR